MRLGRIAAHAGAGLFAGVAGTAAMTLSSTLEAKLRHRSPSTLPAQAASKVLGVQPRNPAGRARFSNAVHWSYGIGWGVVRGLIGSAGLPDRGADVAHFLTIWSAEQTALPALGLAEVPWRQDRTELAVDAFHLGVYTLVTGLAYAALRDDAERATSPGERVRSRLAAIR
jgi:hypothetical protein